MFHLPSPCLDEKRANNRMNPEYKDTKDNPVPSFPDVEQSFQRLVTAYRTRALWFMNTPQTIDLMSPSSVAVLNSIEKKCSTADWVEIKKIKQWLSQNSR